MLKAAKSADIIASMTLEVLQGIMATFDPRVMEVRPHILQANTAANVRNILADSEVIANSQDLRIQDALSLRCVPQLLGAAKKPWKMPKQLLKLKSIPALTTPLSGVEGKIRAPFQLVMRIPLM